ncbi:MAG TPA: 50S ribosomal protein L11 methyltransferase [Candidatus Limnocylindrales bacterium]
MNIGTDLGTFVLTHTSLTQLPFLPELRLHLAEELIPVWQQSEREDPPFWAFAWAGGQALARYLLDHPNLVSGARVLDIASGCGVSAIAAARCGASLVVSNDLDGYPQAAIELNAKANEVEVQFRLGDLLDSTQTGFDVILAGDVFYSREMSSRVTSFLERSTAALALVGDPGRAYAPTQGFEIVATYEVPVNKDLESTEVKRTSILRRVHG